MRMASLRVVSVSDEIDVERDVDDGGLSVNLPVHAVERPGARSIV